ncbi:MAG: polysaccharide deacetylase family protein [Gammaproteobacteria bacterium AqS3]|nr:polysaccharide deacetylase family protein [Gammaproteobacteria bacterium AqS3]
MTQPAWPDGSHLAVSIVVNVEEGAEASIADGDEHPEPVDELGIALRRSIRNYGNESNYEYGLREGFERVRGLLDRHGITATFAAAAVALERAGHIAEYIAEGAHEPCAHGHRWVHQFGMDEAQERDFIERAAVSIEASTGKRPVGWLSRYLHTPATRRLLQRAGFLYCMDDYSGDAPFWTAVEGSDQPLLIVPYALDSNDMKMWIDPGLGVSDWLDYAKKSFDVLYAEAAAGALRMMSLGLHLRIIGRPGRIGALDEFFAHVHRHPDVWIATRRAIAERWQQLHPDRPVRPPLRPVT